MISKIALHQYLHRAHDNHQWVKQQSASWFQDQLTSPILATSYTHQLACTYLGMKYPHFAFFLKMGLGKSKIVLDIFQLRKQLRPSLKALILCPYLINLSGWEKQLQEHAPALTYHILTGSSEERAKVLAEQHADVYVLNYAGFSAMVSTPQRNPKTNKTEWVLDLEKLELFQHTINFLVCDESSALRNHRTLIFEACRALSHTTPFRYLLTGTPFGKTPHDLWTQFMILDHGETFGQTLSIFREGFFITKRNYWKGFEYTFDSKKRDLLIQKMEHRSIQYHLDECMDLPPQIDMPMYFDWDPEAHEYYKTLKQSFIELVKAGGDRVVLTGHFMRLRQLTSGFLMHKDPEETSILRFAHNPKIDGLLELLEQADPADKFILFHFFVETGTLIADALSSQKIKHVHLHTGTKDKAKALDTFSTSAAHRCLILNEQVGALGLNLQMANYLIFFEPIGSSIRREQAAARCRRPGQTKTVFCFDLLVRPSVDERIRESALAGVDLLDSILFKKLDPALL